MDKGACLARVHGVAELDMTEQLSLQIIHSTFKQKYGASQLLFLVGKELASGDPQRQLSSW